MTTIYLIRHSQNDFVREHKLAGRLPDVHLNERGRQQALALADLFAGVKLNGLYSSPLERALETAAPLAERKGMRVVTLPELTEMDYGTWQGRKLSVVSKRKLWPLIQLMPSLARFPEGESFTEAQARVVGVLEKLRSQHKGKKAAFACVFHSDMIKLAVSHYLGHALDLFQRISVSPASITTLSITDRHIRLLGLNDRRATDVEAL